MGWSSVLLSAEATGLPFTVDIAQAIETADTPQLTAKQSAVYGVEPFVHLGGDVLHLAHELLLQRWVDLNQRTLLSYCTGAAPWSEDLIDKLRSLDPS